MRSMTKRNPYRRIENTLSILFGSGAGVILILFFTALGVSMSNSYGWGWWGLFLIPGVLIGGAILMVLGALISTALDALERKWDRSKSRWDYEHGR